MNPVSVGAKNVMPDLGLFDKNKTTNTTDFMSVLADAINQTNEYQVISDQYAEKLVTGEVENLHDVIIAGQKADISVRLLTAVRGKILEAYQEIMRMQI